MSNPNLKYKEVFGIIGVAVLLYVLSNYSNIVLLKIFDLEKPTAFILFLNRLVLWGGLLAFVFYVKYYLKQNFLPWKEKNLSILKSILSIVIILIISFVGFVALVLLIQFLNVPMQAERTPDVDILLQSLPLIILYSFTAAVLEELLFRGYILPVLSKMTNSVVMGIILSSVLFGMVHISYGTVPQVIIPIYLGLVFATYYAKYRSLKIIIICHFIWNLVVYLDSANLL